MSLRVNIGCGRTPTEGWENFDNSPSIKLARSPMLYTLAKMFPLLDENQIENIEWNKHNSIRFADATKSIPLGDGSVRYLYSSHMLEHLSREDAKIFLQEARRVLEPGGVLRLSVPDLRLLTEQYHKDNDPDSFLMTAHMSAPPLKTLRDKLKVIVSGHRHHQWMYDAASLSRLVADAGFKDVTVQPAGATMMEDPGSLDLHERADVSLYVEARA